MRSTWVLTDGVASAQSTDRQLADNWNLEVKPTAPAAGATLRFDEQAIWQVFCVRAEPKHQMQPEEIYVRERDLIARFDQSPSDQFEFQLDWRLLDSHSPTAVGLELWISIQTEDLDSEPTVLVSSESIAGSEWEVLSHGDLSTSSGGKRPAALVSRADSYGCVWFIEPTDQGNADLVTSPSDAQQRVELFGQFIEKGVIRRARMRFHVFQGEPSSEQLSKLYQAFSQSPLPLTA